MYILPMPTPCWYSWEPLHYFKNQSQASHTLTQFSIWLVCHVYQHSYASHTMHFTIVPLTHSAVLSNSSTGLSAGCSSLINFTTTQVCSLPRPLVCHEFIKPSIGKSIAIYTKSILLFNKFLWIIYLVLGYL